jgi:cytosine deaminase
VIDHLLRNARLPSATGLVDVGIDGGVFVSIQPAGVPVEAARTALDVRGALLSPPYVEPHVHLDTCLTAGQPRWNESGTLWEGIA